MLNLGDVFVNIQANVKPLTNASSAVRKFQNDAKGAAKEGGFLNKALDSAAKSAQLTEGPLSGIASRLVTLKGILSTNTVALAATTIALGSFVSLATSAGRAFLAAEDGLVILENTIRSTGRSAEITTKQADELAQSFDNLNVGRQAVATALSFTSIPTAQLQEFLSTAEDLSKVLGRDLQGSVIGIAKAIENPTAALDGLGRAGISFTKIQRENLQLLADTGKKAEVTATILGKIQERTKGVAVDRGASGELERLQKNAQLFREAIFTTSSAGDSLANTLGSLADLFKKFSQEGNLATRAGNIISTALSGLNKSIAFLIDNAESLLKILKIVSAVGIALLAKNLLGLNAIIPVTIRLFSLFALVPPVMIAVAKAIGAAGVIGSLLALGGALAAVLVPIGAVTVGVLAIGYALGDTIKYFSQLGPRLSQTFDEWKNLVSDFTKDFIKKFEDLVSPIIMVIDKLAQPFKDLFAEVKDALGVIVDPIVNQFNDMFGEITKDVSKFTGNLVEDLKGIPTTLKAEVSRGVESTLNELGTSSDRLAQSFEEVKNKAGSMLVQLKSSPLETMDRAADAFFNTIGMGVGKLGDMAGFTYDATGAIAEFNKAIGEATHETLNFSSTVDPFLQTLDTYKTRLDGVTQAKRSLAAVNDSQMLSEADFMAMANGAKDITEAFANFDRQLNDTLKQDFAGKYGVAFDEFADNQKRLSDSFTEVADGLDKVGGKVNPYSKGIRDLESNLLRLDSLLKTSEIENKLAALNKDIKPTLSIEQIKITEAAKQDLQMQLAEMKSPILKGFNSAMDGLGSELSDKFAAKIMGDENTSFRDIARSFTTKLLQTMIDELVMNPLVNSFKTTLAGIMQPEAMGGAKGSTGWGNALGLITSMFGGGAASAATGAGSFGVLASDAASASTGALNFGLPGFAKGGMPQVNRASIVGEKGPELFIPKRKGTIVPNGKGMDMSGNVTNVNFVVNAQDANSFKSARGRITQDLQRTLRNS